MCKAERPDAPAAWRASERLDAHRDGVCERDRLGGDAGERAVDGVAPRVMGLDHHRHRVALAVRAHAVDRDALGAEGVSIHRMRPYGQGDPVPVVIETHDARRDAIDRALARIAAEPVSLADPVAMRIEAL